MKKFSLIVMIIVITFSISFAQKKPLTAEDMYKIREVYDPQVSPDGQWIAYTVAVASIEKNSHNSDIWLIPVNGGTPRQITASPESDHSPRWSPDSKQIAFISDRNGESNVYLININGGEAKQVTFSDFSLGGPVWSKDGKYILCTSRVLPEGKTDIENWTEEELPECEARTTDHLLFRQWDRWLGDKRNHLFLVDMSNGEVQDVTPGDYDNPPVTLSTNHDYDISPDGKEIAFTRNIDKLMTMSTNHEIFIKNLETNEETKITTNPAYDSQPYYSPDGKYIAYVSMQKPGYESDRRCLTIYNRGTKEIKRITESLDRSSAAMVWALDSKRIYFYGRVEGRSPIYEVDLAGNVKQIVNDGYNINLTITPDGKKLVFNRGYNHMPYEVFTLDLANNETKQLTNTNEEFLAEYDLPKLEEFWFEGADGDKVQGFILRPPGFDASKKYPAVLTIHGGPQNMWADRFMTDWWTFQLVSSPGYVGVFINPRGSAGYGSKFREQVSREYGNRTFTDLMKGMDYVIANYDFVDSDKLAAIGGSFGGYSVNWINGHTDRFKCIVSHASLFNLTSFWGATEELFYASWDLGDSPWEDKELFEKWSPHNYVQNFKTPTLVTHGLNDYRVPYGESLQLFTALQMRGIPSRLVSIPGEGHVITGIQNNIRWWKEMHCWLATYLN